VLIARRAAGEKAFLQGFCGSIAARPRLARGGGLRDPERMENGAFVQFPPEAGGLAEPEHGFGRPATTALVARGVCRHLRALGFGVVAELGLASGRRADLACLGPRGEFWIVEVKSSLEDFRADRKWPDYRLHCDRLLFAVAADFPVSFLPEDAGLMIADAYGAVLVREGARHPLPGATRKSMLVRFGLVAALRLHALHDPDFSD
jgi:hypothetical protein